MARKASVGRVTTTTATPPMRVCVLRSAWTITVVNGTPTLPPLSRAPYIRAASKFSIAEVRIKMAASLVKRPADSENKFVSIPTQYCAYIEVNSEMLLIRLGSRYVYRRGIRSYCCWKFVHKKLIHN